MDQNFIQIRNLTDYHLQAFLMCPKSFWREHLLKNRKPSHTPQDQLDQVIEEAITDYFSTLQTDRSSEQILHLIESKRSDKQCRYMDQVLNNVTVFLQTTLAEGSQSSMPISMYEKLSTRIPEWNMSLTMTIPLAYWGEGRLTIKKFYVQDQPELIRSWQYLCMFFCERAFPDVDIKLEMTDALTGKSTVVIPTKQDFTEARSYLELLKETISDPSMYLGHFPKVYN